MLKIARASTAGRGAQELHLGRRAAMIQINTQYSFRHKNGDPNLPPHTRTVVALKLKSYEFLGS